AVSSRLVILEARPGERQVEVHREAVRRLDVTCPFDALAAAGAAGFSRSGIADEDELRVDIESPQGCRGVHAVERRCAKANLAAFRPYKRRHALDADRRSARVVTVKTVTVVQEILDL